jgi:hypothetical protein
MALERRWQANWVSSGKERLLGYAGEIDVYCEYIEIETPVFLVGPDSRKKTERGYNFDRYDIVDGSRIVPDESAFDVHVELSEMCEVYRLVAAAGLIELEVDDA